MDSFEVKEIVGELGFVMKQFIKNKDIRSGYRNSDEGLQYIPGHADDNEVTWEYNGTIAKMN